MNQSTATFLQTIAHKVVLDSLATWNIFNADFNYTIVNTASPTIYFNNLSSNYENLIWSFGDGTTSTTNSPTHQYSSPGNYTVTLTIYTNSGCLIDSVSQNIDIIFTNVNEIRQNQELIIESDLLGRKNKNSKIVFKLDEKGIKTKKIQLKD
jgi:PKD repeat protein